MRRLGLVLAFALCAFTACSGGGSLGGLPPQIRAFLPTPAPTTEAIDSAAIETANGLGAPLKDFAAYEESLPPAAQAGSGCNTNVSYAVPDAKGEANSTETKFYYASGCAIVARDVVRVVSRTAPGVEDVAQTVAIDIPEPVSIASAKPTFTVQAYAQRTTSEHLSSATFDAGGYPNRETGFLRTASSTLTLAAQSILTAANSTFAQTHDGLIVLPATLDQNGNPTNVNVFCNDTAGYVPTNFLTIDESFGWSGGVVAPGTRTLENDGTVMWSATHAGAGVKGPPAGFSFPAAGLAALVCPLGALPTLLNGGSSGGAYTIPLDATFQNGALTNVSLNAPSFPNGYTLALAKTSTQLVPGGYIFIGTLKKDGSTVGMLDFDPYGQGALTMNGGRQYTMVDFHIVKIAGS